MPRTAPSTHPTSTDALVHERWWPIAFTVDLAAEQLHRVIVDGEAFVLFRDATGALRGMEDRCPHRLARLSDGRLQGGEVECLYHGWRFAGDGACSHIPQLEQGASIPTAACVRTIRVVERQGIVWLHVGDDGEGNDNEIPNIDDLEAFDCHTIDFSMDLPYGHDYLIENVLDYAHIHIAHDGVRGGGSQALAGPLAFALSELTPQGFSAHLGRSVGGELSTGELHAAEAAFRAPGLVHYRSIYPKDASGKTKISGLALYAVPLGPGRCRLLYRAYSNFATSRDRRRPRFWEHGYQCHLLEQDMAVVAGQAATIASLSESLGKSWLPLKSSDALVIAYRTWVDRFATHRPDYIGLRTRASDGDDTVATVPEQFPDRFTSHVRQCASCQQALRVAHRLRRICDGVAFVLLAAAACTGSWEAVVFATLAVVSLFVGIGMRWLVRRLTGRGPALRDVCPRP